MENAGSLTGGPLHPAVVADDPERREKAQNCETLIRDDLSKHLRNVKFAPKPMEIAYKWRIDTTVILNRHGYTFLD